MTTKKKTKAQRDAEVEALTAAQWKKYQSAPAEMNHEQAIEFAKSTKKKPSVGVTPAEPKFTPTATVRKSNFGWMVEVQWSCNIPKLLKRSDGDAWLFEPKHEQLAKRLALAINEGRVFSDIQLATDIDGKTFVTAYSRITGRTANAELTRMGY